MPSPDSDVVFHAEPFTDRCDHIRRRAEHALIGVSTGNSYFSAQRLTWLVRWAQSHFAAVDLICADLHIEDMLIAEGAGPAEAKRRAGKRVKDVRRRIRQAVEGADPDRPRPRAHVLSDFAPSPEYQRLRADITRALHQDAEFTAACQDMVRRYVLGRSNPSERPSDGDCTDDRKFHAGLDYLCAELPFFVDTPSILGVPSSISCYHVVTPVLNALFRRTTGLRAVENQGFLRVAPREAEHSP